LGEETGHLPETLELISRHFTAETENCLKGLLSILEPCITLLLAVLVILILLCVYLPVFEMYGGI
jgi:type II secretory pathway component PulF